MKKNSLKAISEVNIHWCNLKINQLITLLEKIPSYLQSNKNVLQFLLISAHGRIPCKLVSKYWVHVAVHQGAGGM